MGELAKLKVTVRGVVQGVGYRMFVSRQARLHGLAGQVRNMPDGSVEVIGVGPRETLELLLAELRRGPLGGRVDDMECEWKKTKDEFQGFEIRY